MADDLATLLNEMNSNGNLDLIVRNPVAQFGVPNRQYIGAQLLPESIRESNAYREEFIRFRSVVANNGTRYSPVQYKKGALAGSMLVTLAESDIGSDLTSREFDVLRKLIGGGNSPAAMAQITNWADTVLNVPLIEKNEVMRWQAIVDAQVVLKGNGGYYEEINYSNPTGNRVAASAAWSNNATDPYTDIFAIKNKAAAKGLRIKRIITTTAVVSIMANNAKVQSRTGSLTINIGGTGVAVAGSAAGLDKINGALQSNGLPAIETYDLQYRTSTGTRPFLAAGVMVLICDAQRDPSLDLGDTTILAPEILDRINGQVGYVAIGTPAGYNTPGRALWMQAYGNKPPRVVGESWQTSVPVISEPDAIYTIFSIT